MGEQSSEMKGSYRGRHGLPHSTKFRAGPQPFNLSQHFCEGPSQQVIASTKNTAMTAKPFFVRDKGVLNLNDIYMSTTQKDHRSFKKYVINSKL